MLSIFHKEDALTCPPEEVQIWPGRAIWDVKPLSPTPSPIKSIAASAQPASELIRLVAMIYFKIGCFATTFTSLRSNVGALVLIEPLPLLIVADAATSELAIAAMS